MKKKILEINFKTKPNLLESFKKEINKPTTYSTNRYDWDDDEDWGCCGGWWDSFGDYPLDYDNYGFDDDGYDKDEEEWQAIRKELMDRYGIIDVDEKKPKNKKKTHKTVSEETRKKIAKKRKEKFNDDKRFYEEHDDSLDFSTFQKKIRFYRDYENPDKYEEFTDLYTFDDFCEREGIDVSEDECRNLLLRDNSYCCINPASRNNGKPMLITDSSYGGLRWACAESDDELVENYSS